MDKDKQKNKISEKADRIKKLEALEALGIKAYPAKSKRTHLISELLERFSDFENQQSNLVIAGRLKSKRSHGNLTFCNIEDASGNMQIAVSKKEIDSELLSYKNFVKLIDVGDFVEVEGKAFVTHKGENSLNVKKWQLLSKALSPLPDKWHGLKNDEERFRKRYLDILMNPGLKDLLQKKSKFWDSTRSFMKDKGFFEVETPTLETTTGGAEANPFRTHHDDFDMDVFLRISVGELWQKRLMAAGFEKTFEIGRIYRNEGSSPEHLQEFTNMEFYWAYADYNNGMELTRELYQTLAKEVFGTSKFEARGHIFDLSDEWIKIDYKEEIKKQTGIDVIEASEDEMMKKLKELKVEYDGDNKERMTDSLWKYCRKSIAGPAFLINHPKLISPLAKSQPEDPETVQRFQILLAGAEVGNGYSELNNPIDQRKRFEEQQKLLEAGDSEAMMPDWEFVEMLEYGMPPTCGFGFGERLFSFLANKPIRETTLFPLVKPKMPVKHTETQLSIKNKSIDSAQDKKLKINKSENLGIDYDGAVKLLEENISDEITKFHCFETEAIMRTLAKHFGEDEEKWGIIGLLHDIDWDMTKEDVKNHTVKAVDILKDAGASDFLIETVVSHAWGNKECGEYPDQVRETRIQHALVASETMTGIIVAAALVQPDKKLASVKLSSLKKKFKQKSFAANCDRNLIREIEKTGLEVADFFEISLKAVQGIAKKINL